MFYFCHFFFLIQIPFVRNADFKLTEFTIILLLMSRNQDAIKRALMHVPEADQYLKINIAEPSFGDWIEGNVLICLVDLRGPFCFKPVVIFIDVSLKI